MQWLCSFCSEGPYVSETKFRTHLRDQHSDNFIESQLPILVNDGRRPMENLSAADCPFCDNFEQLTRELNPQVPPDEILTVSWAAFRNHVGRHMKELATFAIPRCSDEDDQDSIATGDSAKAAVAVTDVDLLQKEVAPRKVAPTVGSEISNVESIGAPESEMEDIEEIVPIPDAPDNSFIGINGLPQGK